MEAVFTLVVMLLLLDYGKARQAAFSSRCGECTDLQDNLQRNLTITSNFDVGSTVYSFTINSTTHRCEAHHNVPDNVPFMLEHNTVQGVWHLKVKSCLVAGTEHTLEFSLHQEAIQCNRKVSSSLKVLVLPTIPNFKVPKEETNMYYVTECEDQALKLVFAITSSSICVSLTCSVDTIESKTSESIFMVKDGQNIYAYVDKIKFLSTYLIKITCIEVGAVHYKYADEFQVYFIDERDCQPTSSVTSVLQKSTHVMEMNRNNPDYTTSANVMCQTELPHSVTVDKSPDACDFTDIAILLVWVNATLLFIGAIAIVVGFLVCRHYGKQRATRPIADEEINNTNHISQCS